MFYNKYGITAISGIGLLFIGVPQLPLELSGELDFIFSFSWVSLALLTIIANWRQMLRLDVARKHRAEALRRKQWLQAESQMRRSMEKNNKDRRGIIRTV